MTEKAILSAIIFTVICLFLCYVIIGILNRLEEEWYNGCDEAPNAFVYGLIVILLFMVLPAIMLIYTNFWITITAGIMIIIRRRKFLIDVNNEYRITKYSFAILCWFLILCVIWLPSKIIGMYIVHPAEQHIETESRNIVYGENIKIEDLSQDIIYIEKIVLEEHYSYEYYSSKYIHEENEDSYRYYYKIEEKNGKTKSMSEMIQSNDVKIEYVEDRKKAMMKKIVTEMYYEKPFFGIEIPILKKDVETKYEFYIPRELLEVVEIK